MTPAPVISGTSERSQSRVASSSTAHRAQQSRRNSTMMWRIARSELHWLPPKLDEMFRILLTYGAINVRIPDGDQVVAERNAFDDEHRSYLEQRAEIEHARTLLPVQEAHAQHQRHSAISNGLVIVICVAGAAIVVPIGGVVAALGLAVAGAGVFETGRGAVKSIRRYQGLERITEQMRAQITQANLDRLDQMKRDLDTEVSSITNDQHRKSVQLGRSMRENDNDPHAHPSMIRLQHAGHYRDLVRTIAMRLIERHPDAMRSLFGPMPPLHAPDGANQQLEYFEFVCLSFLGHALDNGLRYFSLQPQEAQDVGWTFDDVRAHIGTRVQEMATTHHSNVRHMARTIKPGRIPGRHPERPDAAVSPPLPAACRNVVDPGGRTLTRRTFSVVR